MTEDDGYETIVPDVKPCTCQPADNPPLPCARKYAYTDCVVAKAIRQAAYNQALKDAASAGYVACAETRHVSLGDKVTAAILSLGDKSNG